VIEADVAVVGAGPAGTAAAITLAGLGLRVTILDRARFPRDKCCGDGLTTGALRHLDELGLAPAAVASWQPVREARIRAPGGRQATFTLPENGTLYAATAQRIDLDAALVELARGKGVEVLEGRSLYRAELEPGGQVVRLGFEDGTCVRAWYAIGADGMWSPLRKLLGLAEPGYLGEWHALRQYFDGAGPLARQFWVWFEPDLIPGYAWSFPLPDGRVNIGLGVLRRPGRSTGHLKELWADVLTRPHVREVLEGAAPDGAWKTWPIPARISRSPLSGLDGRVLFVGDAARAADPMTGEGIAQALETGRLAGDVIAAAGPDRPSWAAARYARRIGTGMAVDDWASRVLSRVLESERGSGAWMRLADRSPRTRRHFARWMFEDYPRALFVTPHRWSRGALHRPGAFSPGGPVSPEGSASPLSPVNPAALSPEA
jgi:menaquinone-9 beta-reductase